MSRKAEEKDSQVSDKNKMMGDFAKRHEFLVWPTPCLGNIECIQETLDISISFRREIWESTGRVETSLGCSTARIFFNIYFIVCVYMSACMYVILPHTCHVPLETKK